MSQVQVSSGQVGGALHLCRGVAVTFLRTWARGWRGRALAVKADITFTTPDKGMT